MSAEQGSEEWLLVADANKIQNYLFESVRLREIMGASVIIQRFNTEIEALLRSEFGAKVIYSNGGAIKAIFSKENVARSAANKIRQLYHNMTNSGTISVANPIRYINEGDGFKEALIRAEFELRRVKEQGSQDGSVLVSNAYLALCDTCGLRPASYREKYDPEETSILVCATCHKKLKVRGDNRAGAFYFDRLNAFLEEAKLLTQKESRDYLFGPMDFDEIGKKDNPSGYVGFIIADGNAMGEKLHNCKKPEDYEKLSKTIEAVTCKAVCQTALTVFDLTDKPKLEAWKARKSYLPFQVLVLGGDDVVIATTADTALQFAILLCQNYQKFSGRKLSISVGVVIAKANLPFLISYQLGYDLLKSAKRLSKAKANENQSKPELGSVDFQVVTTSNALEYSRIVEERTYFDRKGLKPAFTKSLTFSGRPYVTEEFPGAVNLQRLIELIAKLKANDMPRSQLSNFGEILNKENATRIQANGDFSSFLDRLNEEYRRAAKRLIKEREIQTTWLEIERLGQNLNVELPEKDKFYATLPGIPEESKVVISDVEEIYEFVTAAWVEPEHWMGPKETEVKVDK